MAQEGVVFSRVTAATRLGYDLSGLASAFVELVNGLVAVLARHVKLEIMHIAAVFGGGNLVTEGAVYLLRPILTGNMLAPPPYMTVATRTCVVSMDRTVIACKIDAIIVTGLTCAFHCIQHTWRQEADYDDEKLN